MDKSGNESLGPRDWERSRDGGQEMTEWGQHSGDDRVGPGQDSGDDRVGARLVWFPDPTHELGREPV